MAAIAGASKALDLKARNPSKTDEEILREITEKADGIVRKIDEGD